MENEYLFALFCSRGRGRGAGTTHASSNTPPSPQLDITSTTTGFAVRPPAPLATGASNSSPNFTNGIFIIH